MTYADKLKDPRWQKKRLKILERDEWMCQQCQETESTLMVHHFQYLKDCEPWEYDDHDLITLCKYCHEAEHRERKPFEDTLLNVLRFNHFFSHDILELASAINQMLFMCGSMYDNMKMLHWALKNEDIMNYINDEYIKYLKNNKKK